MAELKEAVAADNGGGTTQCLRGVICKVLPSMTAHVPSTLTECSCERLTWTKSESQLLWCVSKASDSIIQNAIILRCLLLPKGLDVTQPKLDISQKPL